MKFTNKILKSDQSYLLSKRLKKCDSTTFTWQEVLHITKENLSLLNYVYLEVSLYQKTKLHVYLVNPLNKC